MNIQKKGRACYTNDSPTLFPSFPLELPGESNDAALPFTGKLAFGASSPSPRAVETWQPTSPLDFDCALKLDFLDFPNLLDAELDVRENVPFQLVESCSPVLTDATSVRANDASDDAVIAESETATIIQSEGGNCETTTPLRLQLAYLENVLNGSTQGFEGVEIGHLNEYSLKGEQSEKRASSLGGSGGGGGSKGICKVAQTSRGITSGRGKSKGNSEWAHLSEEELKKLRRVKNRASVEKCRTKQRLRMEALQMEMNVLTCENLVMRETANKLDGMWLS